MAAVAIGCALVAFAIAAAQPRMYRVTAKALVRTSAADSGEMLHGLDVLMEPAVMDTIAALAPIAATDARAMHDDIIESDIIEDTNLLTISITGRSAQHVAALANALPAAMNARMKPLFPMYSVSLLEAVAPPSRAATPRLIRALISGLIAGLAAGSALALLRERRLHRVVQD